MSADVFMSDGLADLLPVDFKNNLSKSNGSDLEFGSFLTASIFSENDKDRFLIEFETKRENALCVFKESLHKTILLPQYFGDVKLVIDGIEVKYPGPTLTLKGIIKYS